MLYHAVLFVVIVHVCSMDWHASGDEKVCTYKRCISVHVVGPCPMMCYIAIFISDIYSNILFCSSPHFSALEGYR